MDNSVFILFEEMDLGGMSFKGKNIYRVDRTLFQSPKQYKYATDKE
jgi:hypothetical protein